MTTLSISIPDTWHNRTDQSVPTQGVNCWLELTRPWQEVYRGVAGVWTVDADIARSIPPDVKGAGPLGCHLSGVVVGSLAELRQVEQAEFVLLNGEDAAGRCGRDSTFVLMQALAQSGRRGIVRGGIGPELLAAAQMLGIDEVLAEEIVWPALNSLPSEWTTLWGTGAPNENRTFGPQSSPGRMAGPTNIRFWAKPGFAVTREATEAAATEAWPTWQKEKRATLEDVGPKDKWVAAGGATGLAGRLNLHGDLVSRLSAITAEAKNLVRDVHSDWPWRAGAGWSEDAACELPISQGPMANVADVPAFAKVVSDHGAFPWFALASAPEQPVRDMFAKAKASLPANTYGAGIIGMSTNPMLDTHIRLCKEFGIEWLLVAAANVDMALRLEREGFRTVLHTPAPEMLATALDVGLKRFVWEGREAGGHVGILGSASLWQHNLAVLKQKQVKGVTVLLAGGLGPREAALAAAPFGAALRALGVKQGLQLGSAYLKTKDAEATGAIATTYRQALAQGVETVVAGESSGAPTRLVATPRAMELAASEQVWIREGVRTPERKHRFEQENFGGLRLAAKAQKVVIDDQGPRLETVPLSEGVARGLFHMGAVGALRSASTIAELHADISTPEIVVAAPQVNRGLAADIDRNAIAIVGMGFRLPGAEASEDALWELILSGRSVVGRIPAEHWHAPTFIDLDANDPSRTYTDLAACILPAPFDGRKYRIPPKVVQALDTTQTLAIELTAAALANAGYPDDVDARTETDVILGVAQGDMRVRTDGRVLLNALATHGGMGADAMAAVEAALGFSLPLPTEDSMPGELANVTAGRVAAVFDFKGANFTTDAACASSLAAIHTAADRLRLGRCDWAVTGGIDRNMGIGAYVKFCRLGALSREGSFPFDRRASGFVMGEGGAVFVLRRLTDALCDGNAIRGIIVGTGLSSDGKGKGITAPNPAGQALAVRRAWKDAGLDGHSIGWIEAHGTGTKVGDLAEVETLRELFDSRREALGVGSIKGNIGHLKAGAGAAALAKAVLSFERGLIPPSGNYAEARPELQLDGQPLYVLDHVEHWGDKPQRIGINSFGFGGTDAHLVVAAGNASIQPLAENVQPTHISEGRITMYSESPGHAESASATNVATPNAASLHADIAQIVAQATGYDAGEIESHLEFEGDLGIDTVKIAEVIGLVRERFGLPEDPDLVLSNVGTVAAVAEYVAGRMLEEQPSAISGQLKAEGIKKSYRPAQELWRDVEARVVAAAGQDTADLLENLRRGVDGAGRLRFAAERERFDLDKVAAGFTENWDLRRWQRSGAAVGLAGKNGFAFLFPGQGTQQAGMLAELRGIDIVEATIAEAAAILDPILGVPLARFLGTPNPEEKEAIEQELKQTRFTQPVLLTVEVALYRLLLAQGIAPAAVGGHSLGEFAACVAAGVLSFPDALRIVSGRGKAMEDAAAKIADPGAMVAVGVDAKSAATLLVEYGFHQLQLANQNSPTQTVVGGATADIDALCAKLAGSDLPHKRLKVSHAFHTSIVAAAAEPLASMLAKVDVQLPKLPIYSNVTAEPYPNDLAEIKRLLAIQLASPVRFVDMIEGMLGDNVAGFVEVGAGRVLSNLAGEIAPADKGAWPTYLPGKGAPEETLAKLWTGVSVFRPATDIVPDASPVIATAKKKLPPLQADDLVISGIAAGVPGLGEPFAAEALAALLRGDNRIQPVTVATREAIAKLGIEHVAKDASGAVRTQKIDSAQVGLKFSGSFDRLPDLSPYGVPKPAQNGLDATSRFAVAAGFAAIKDAALPLVPRPDGDKYMSATKLPAAIAARTGIVYGTVFGGVDEVIKTASGQQPFSRTFLVEALSLAHSHLARFLGVTGPTMQMNNACASTVGALCVAEDWLRAGRCDRVIVIAADVAGGSELLPYVGGGFLAVGAASTEADLESAAQPFGKDRQGTIIGSGAVAFVVERAGDCAARGLRPRARLLATHLSNDACHPLKMNPSAISGALDTLLTSVEKRIDFSRADIANDLVFVSHEPFTPAKGGSADSEATALRACFGAAVGNVPIANVKGYTGHPMGASLEDVVAIMALEHGQLPPVRNAHLQDPALADLKLSRGEKVDAQLALHLAAGFGAQIGWVLYGKVEGDGERVDADKYRDWEKTVGGAVVATDASPMVVSERQWAWRPVVMAGRSPLPIHSPLRSQRPLGWEDVVDVIAAWRRLLVEGAPQAVMLPLSDADTWTHVAAEALAGMTRAFQRERPESNLRLVWADDVEHAAAALASSDEPEIMVGAGKVATPVWVPLPQNHARAGTPPGNWLLVGGGRGITALLAKRWANAGMNELWLVGRRSEPDAQAAAWRDDDIRERAKAALAGERNPRRFQQVVESLQADRELAQTLAELRASGAKIVYIACDIAVASDVRRLETALRESGSKLAGIVHAGGIEFSAAIERVGDDDIDRVSAPKLQGTLHLLRLAKAMNVKHFVGFGSIAHAVGNAGQTVYAAANGALKGLADVSGLTALTVAWSAWSGAGMATRGAIPKLLAQQGIDFLDPEAAFSELEALLASADSPGSVLVARGLGKQLSRGFVQAELPAHAAAAFVTGPSDPFVDDHRIQGMAVFPGVFGLEAIWKTYPAKSGVRVDYERAIRFVDDRDVTITVANDNKGGFVVEHGHDGRAKRKPAYTFHWTEVDVPQLGQWAGESFVVGATSRQEIYARLFHGPNFQVLDRAYWNDRHAWAESNLPVAPALRTHALAVEAMLQLGGLWVSGRHGVDVLPVSIAAAYPGAAPQRLETGVVRVALLERSDRDWQFRGEWLAANGQRVAASFTLRDTGVRHEPLPAVAPAVTVAKKTFDAVAENGVARSEAHKAASQAAWQTAIQATLLGLNGCAPASLTSPEPASPFQDGNVSLHWSRSHTDGLAVAACLAANDGRLGIDVEQIVPRAPAFWREISGAGERSVYGDTVDDRTATAIWCAKEATVKALGTGLSLPLADIEVAALSPTSCQVQLRGKAAEAAQDAGVQATLTVTFSIDANMLTAIAVAPRG